MNKAFSQVRNILEILSISLSFIIIGLFLFIIELLGFLIDTNISLSKSILLYLLMVSFYVVICVVLVGGLIRRKKWSYWVSIMLMSFMIIWWVDFLGLLRGVPFPKVPDLFVIFGLMFLLPFFSIVMLIFKIFTDHKKIKMI